MGCHDVRNLKVCKRCGLLAEVVVKGCHPRCLTEKELLSASVEELNRVTISDVGIDTIVKIIARLDKRARGSR